MDNTTTAARLPEPLVPAEANLRTFEYLPLVVSQLRDSEFVVTSSGEGFKAAMLLWCAAWHQEPAASLPDNDRLLASMAGFGRDVTAFQAIKDEALYGFIKCSDERLYHPVLAERAMLAWGEKKQNTKRTAAATAARKAKDAEKERKRQEAQRHDQGDENVTANVTAHNDARHDQRNDDQLKGTEGKRTEPKQKEENPTSNVVLFRDRQSEFIEGLEIPIDRLATWEETFSSMNIRSYIIQKASYVRDQHPNDPGKQLDLMAKMLGKRHRDDEEMKLKVKAEAEAKAAAGLKPRRSLI